MFQGQLKLREASKGLSSFNIVSYSSFLWMFNMKITDVWVHLMNPSAFQLLENGSLQWV